ncbi:MAG: MBL fold metallo-hydrolase [Bernardetiaceae bacterium]|jgi:metallo-beta-lactamase family protein|nr:MBL fold metallo-hydrolase [Bernardetiaceae bacterium]
MKLTFWGAAQQVTGSMFLLETDDEYKVLIDCGYDMERARQNGNAAPMPQAFPGSVFPFEASMLNLVLLTHAHVDHSGNIPNLYREGYEGQVLCTTPTAELTHLLLLDSAQMHKRKLAAANAGGKKRKKRPAPLPSYANEWYVERQVEDAMDNFVGIAFNQRFKIKRGLEVTFVPAGHLLGAANILLHVKENGVEKTLCFSGDIGRFNYPLLVDPHPLPPVDYLVCETTYGARNHRPNVEIEAELEQIIHETCVEIPGRLIIPAFSIGRTQAMLYMLNRMAAQGKLPPIKIFSDSPLALQSTKTYVKNAKHLNQTARDFLAEHGSLFDFDNLVYVEDLKTSKAVANYHQPCVIISSSGMLEGGRIQHHIRTNLSNPYCTILMIGYASEGTLGRKLLDGNKSVVVGDKELAVMARIVYTDAFSGHGDQTDLLNFVGQHPAERLQKLFLVHGEVPAMETFRGLLAQRGYQQVELPARGQTFEL